MKSDKIPFYFWWVLALFWLAILVFYVFTHDYYLLSDNIYEVNGARMVAQSWWLQDAKLIPRPGYLLNLPFIQLGLSFYALKILCLVTELAAFLTFIWQYDRHIFKTEFLPMGLLIFTAVYTQQFQVVFDYYSVVLIFLLFGLAAFLKSLQSPHTHLFAFLAAGCWVIAAFANLALPGAFLILILTLTMVYRRQADWWMLLAFVFGFTVLLLVYGVGTHAWFIFHNSMISGHTWDEIKDTSAFLIFICVIYILLMIPTLFSYLMLDGVCKDLAVLFWMLLCFLVYCFSPLLDLKQLHIAYFQWYFSVGFIMATLTSFLFVGRGWLRRDQYRKCLLVFLTIGFILFCNRVISHGLYVSFLFSPILLFLIFWHFNQRYFRAANFWIYIVLVACLAYVPYTQIFQTYGMSSYIDVNQYPSFRGVFVDRYTADTEKNLMVNYQKYGCEKKPFFAFYNFTSAYWMTKRASPINVTYVPNGYFEFMSRFGTNQALINFFSKQKHWCIAVRPNSWNDIYRRRLAGFTKWIIKSATHEIPLGRLYYQHTFVWLYVK